MCPPADFGTWTLWQRRTCSVGALPTTALPAPAPVTLRRIPRVVPPAYCEDAQHPAESNQRGQRQQRRRGRHTGCELQDKDQCDHTCEEALSRADPPENSALTNRPVDTPGIKHNGASY